MTKVPWLLNSVLPWSAVMNMWPCPRSTAITISIQTGTRCYIINFSTMPCYKLLTFENRDVLNCVALSFSVMVMWEQIMWYDLSSCICCAWWRWLIREPEWREDMDNLLTTNINQIRYSSFSTRDCKHWTTVWRSVGLYLKSFHPQTQFFFLLIELILVDFNCRIWIRCKFSTVSISIIQQRHHFDNQWQHVSSSTTQHSYLNYCKEHKINKKK